MDTVALFTLELDAPNPFRLRVLSAHKCALDMSRCCRETYLGIHDEVENISFRQSSPATR